MMTEATEQTTGEESTASGGASEDATNAGESSTEQTTSPGGSEPGAGASDDTQSGFGSRADTPSGDDSGSDLPDFGEAYLGEDGKPDLSKVAERLKAADERAAAAGEVPEDPSGYELPSAEDLGLPEDFKGGFDAEDPELQAFLKSAVEAGKGKEQVKQELTTYAKAVTASVQKYHEARNAKVDAEFEKIGADRFTAARTALQNIGGDEKGEAMAQALGSIDNAALFEVVEALITKANGGGDSPAGASGRDGNVTSFADRWASAGKKSA
jgi:hypothetical protein